MENALPKKKLKIYLKPFSIYKNIVYLKNSFHHLTPKDFFIYNKIILSKLKLFEYQNDPEKFNKYIDKLFIKYFNDFYKFNFKNILFFSNFKLFNFFLENYINKYEILPFINLNSGLRYNETDLKSINEKTNFNTKKIIKIIDLSLFFSFIPMNLDNFINDNNIDAIYIDLSKSFGIPINYIIFYFKSLNIFDCKIIFQKFDDVNVKISIISMIKFFKKFGVYKLINLTTRNYYFIYNKLNEIANSSIHNNKIKFKLNQIPSNYSKYNKDYLRKFPSFLIPIEFESDKLASEIYNKLLENKIFTELYKNFIIISPSFYNTLEDFNLFLDTLKEI